MSEYWELLVTFLKEHQEWTLPIAFLISMGESIIGISLFIPSTIIFVAISTVMGASGVDIVPIWIAAGLGAWTGDWISYGIGYFFEHRLNNVWPLRDNQDLVKQGHEFFERWGWLSLFICRFVGPLRSLVPLIAGICDMPLLQFAIASFLSAMLWAGVVLAPGTISAWLTVG